MVDKSIAILRVYFKLGFTATETVHQIWEEMKEDFSKLKWLSLKLPYKIPYQ